MDLASSRFFNLLERFMVKKVYGYLIGEQARDQSIGK